MCVRERERERERDRDPIAMKSFHIEKVSPGNRQPDSGLDMLTG